MLYLTSSTIIDALTVNKNRYFTVFAVRLEVFLYTFCTFGGTSLYVLYVWRYFTVLNVRLEVLLCTYCTFVGRTIE